MSTLGCRRFAGNPHISRKTMLHKTTVLYITLFSFLMLTASAHDVPRPLRRSAQANETSLDRVQPTRQSQRSSMKELKSSRLFTLTIKLQPTIELGDTPAGKRRIFAVTGGEFEGDRIRGTIMPVIGSDLLLVGADGSARQDVRMLLKTDDGAMVLMTYRGVRHASDEVNARIARGEPVSGADYYLRTVPFFETSSPKYAWINKIVSVGVGERRADSVVYQVFEIL
jgi:hypothetical protein